MTTSTILCKQNLSNKNMIKKSDANIAFYFWRNILCCYLDTVKW